MNSSEAVDSEIEAFGNEELLLRDVQLTRQERDKLDARDRELDLAQRSVREQLLVAAAIATSIARRNRVLRRCRRRG